MMQGAGGWDGKGGYMRHKLEGVQSVSQSVSQSPVWAIVLVQGTPRRLARPARQVQTPHLSHITKQGYADVDIIKVGVRVRVRVLANDE